MSGAGRKGWGRLVKGDGADEEDDDVGWASS